MRVHGTKLGAISTGRGLGDQLYDLAGLVPSLDLNFSDNKSLIDDYSGANLVTHTRASSGTFVGSDGVIQTAVTNLTLNSEDFSAATWTLLSTTVTANAAVAPTGATTADTLLETATSAEHVLYSTNPHTFTTATHSIYVKPNGRTNVALRFYHGLSDWVVRVFSLTGSGSVTQSSAGLSSGFSAVSSSIVDAGNGWYRLSITATQSSRATAAAVLDLCSSSTPTLGALSGSEAYLGDVTKGVYVWGSQLEAGAFPTSYIPTTSTINSAPRFDHNPTTGESLGLLVEEQRTNLLLRSEEFDNASWTLSQATTVSANSIVSPSGQVTADKIVETIANSTHYRGAFFTLAANITCTASVYVKAGERRYTALQLTPDGTNYIWCTFDLQLGTASTPVNAGNGSGATATIQALPNGWYRCSLTGIPSSTAANPGLAIYLLNANVNLSLAVYTGDGTSGIYIWGAQIEAGAFPTSYIPTTSAAVTRSADVASITGSAFSSWYSQSEGTVFVNWIRSTNVTGAGRVLLATDGTINNRNYDLRQDSSSGLTAIVINSTNLEVALSLSLNTLTGRNSLAFGVAANNAAASANGGAASLDNSLSIPVVNRLEIGSIVGTSFINGTIRRLTFWGQRLPNNVLQSITQ
jgi:hypothetical protein